MPACQPLPPSPDAVGRRRVLLVDDSHAQRLIIRAALAQWGYEVVEAGSGEEGLARCTAGEFDIILSDWLMPGMSGLDFCRAFRALPGDGYGYFILLTSKSAKEEVARGLDAGADDFLSKPVNPAELHARIRAGERLVTAQRELRAKNQLLGATLGELQSLYDALDRDLIEARRLQQSLVRDRHHDFGTGSISRLLRPSGHVGGDLVGYTTLAHGQLAIFSVDVSGHGVASAMMAARLAGTMGAIFPGECILVDHDRTNSAPRPPEQVVQRLNRLVLDLMQVDQYFTCVYGSFDPHTGRLQLVQAGHPHPLLLGADGTIRRIGSGGLPVGLFPAATWEPVDLALAPGDRVLLLSDGCTECRNAADQELGEAGIIAMIHRLRHHRGEGFLTALEQEIGAFAGHDDFADDLSAILLEWRGPKTP